MPATMVNRAAIWLKPSSLASLAMRGYISVHSSCSPPAAIFRQVAVSGISPPFSSLNQILACSFSLAAVSSKILAIWT